MCNKEGETETEEVRERKGGWEGEGNRGREREEDTLRTLFESTNKALMEVFAPDLPVIGTNKFFALTCKETVLMGTFVAFHALKF